MAGIEVEVLNRVERIEAALNRGYLKRVQRGVAAAETDITIDAVNPAKTFIRSFSTGSAGHVAARADLAATLRIFQPNSQGNPVTGSSGSYSITGALSGGDTDLTTAAYGAYLVDATTIHCTGPCRFEVIEFY